MIESTEKILKIVAVYFSPSGYISSISEDGENATVNFHDGRDWEEIKFAEATFAEPESETNDGPLYKQNLSLVLAGDDETIQASIKELRTSKPVFKIEFDNEESKLIGDIYNYCILSTDFSSKDFETKREISATRLSAIPALFID